MPLRRGFPGMEDGMRVSSFPSTFVTTGYSVVNVSSSEAWQTKFYL
jgi:hypothetical protein